ncbi:MAG: protein kinase [Myxococcaceae bacterium]
MTCPADDVLARVATQGASPSELDAVDAHLDNCEDCRRVLAAAVPLGEPARAQQIAGRYELLHLVGAGAMGTVWAARDLKLERTVALKLVRTTSPLAEARSLARVSHPNVVQVFDVGDDGEQRFVAMEFIDGQTLRQWLRAPRTPAEVLSVFAAAGAGLAAAHRAGLVHRDFKPDNVLINVDGSGATHVRVSDFGLASSEHRLAGTPAYLSPEVLAGAAASARSDQFAFCVSLVEALTGRRPTATERTAALAGQSAPVRAALARGLSEDPAARFESVEALLTALTAPPTKNSPTWWVLGAAAVVALAWLAWPAPEVPAAPPLAVTSPAAPDARATVTPAPPRDGFRLQRDVLEEEELNTPLPPVGQPIVLALGDERPFQVEGVKSVTLAQPEVLDAEGLGDQLTLRALTVGKSKLTVDYGWKKKSWLVEVREPVAEPPRAVSLAPGALHEVEVPLLMRLSIGDTSIVDLQSRQGSRLRFQALKPGVTNVLLWTRDARRLELSFTVTGGPGDELELRVGVQRVVKAAPFEDVRVVPADLCAVQIVGAGEVLLVPRREGEGALELISPGGAVQRQALRVRAAP